jgi:bacillithiol system protein YtxJ
MMQIDPHDERFALVTTQVEYEELLARSQTGPVVLFKHDTACPISSMAYKQLQELECGIAVVDVEACHELSQAIASHTGVRHESPQVIVLRGGAPCWTASSFRISSADVRRALRDRELNG